jgi:hypothetical protein
MDEFYGGAIAVAYRSCGSNGLTEGSCMAYRAALNNKDIEIADCSLNMEPIDFDGLGQSPFDGINYMLLGNAFNPFDAENVGSLAVTASGISADYACTGNQQCQCIMEGSATSTVSVDGIRIQLERPMLTYVPEDSVSLADSNDVRLGTQAVIKFIPSPASLLENPLGVIVQYKLVDDGKSSLSCFILIETSYQESLVVDMESLSLTPEGSIVLNPLETLLDAIILHAGCVMTGVLDNENNILDASSATLDVKIEFTIH